MTAENMSDQDLEKYVLPMTMKKTSHRTAKGPIAITRVDSKGDFIVLENTCIKKPIVLTNWTLRRRGVDVPVNSFTFEKHFVLHPGRIVKISAKDKGRNNPPHEIMSETVNSWGVGTYVFTQLVNHLNQEKATLLEKVEHYEREIKPAPKVIPLDTTDLLNKHYLQGGLIENGNSNYDLVDTNYEYYFERNIHS